MSNTTDSGCSIPCNLCDSCDVDELSVRDRHRHYLRTVICKHCGLVWTDPRLDAEYVARFYQTDYRVAYKGIFEPHPIHVYRAGLSAIEHQRTLAPHLAPGARVLDVGAGGGEFLYLLLRLNYRASGIEPNEGYARYAIREYGVDIRVSTLQQVPLPPAEFDCITLWHVLEHVEDPLGLAARLRASLRPKGVLAVEVPNIGAVCQSPGHRFHSAHLYAFNPATLEALGGRAGFEVVSSLVVPDGGTLTVLFRRVETLSKPPALRSNCERIRSILRRHALFAHYRSRHPYVRPLRKLARFASEYRAVRSHRHGKEILDRLYEPELVSTGSSMQRDTVSL